MVLCVFLLLDSLMYLWNTIFNENGFSEEPDVSSDPYDNYDLENELVMIYIDLGIEFDDVETGDEVSVSKILDFNH